jgi:tetratricopeptide (TPR) repeat protein
MIQALRLSPRDPCGGFFMILIGTAYYFEGDYRNALSVENRALSLSPLHPYAHRYVAASLGQLGRIEEAEIALCRQSRFRPNLSTSTLTVVPRGFNHRIMNTSWTASVSQAGAADGDVNSVLV